MPLTLTENERLAEGTHTYFVGYSQNCNVQNDSTATLTITFPDQDYMTLRTPDQAHRGTGNKDYTRQGDDLWFSLVPIGADRLEMTLLFGPGGFKVESKSIVGNDIVNECTVTWVRLGD